MKSTHGMNKKLLGALLAAVFGLWSIGAAHAQTFVANSHGGTIGEYTAAGATVNSSPVAGLDDPNGIVVVPVPVPDPPTWALVLVGLGFLAFLRLRTQGRVLVNFYNRCFGSQ